MGKVTIADILERKNVIKPLDLTFYSEELGGEIEIKKVDPDTITNIVAETDKIGQYKAYCKLIYNSCSIFKAKELHEKYKPVEPYEIVDIVLNTNVQEVFSLGNKILQIYGFIPRGDINAVKKP